MSVNITIYLAPNITDITLLRPLLTLFVQQVMDILTLEHDPNSLPVYFLLDEFRQLKRMDEIMTKLPYVAGYKIKLAFIIQDLKNLDEIYGETSRHSLLGNCGYHLILGANDQATADYASRALGKRTIRYSSESRTIEIMGLPRRTKVEQIRERDLMMSQEVRQMPENRMILLVEGQRPIFAEKLRFFNTQPFKAAEAYAQAHIPSVPDIEYLLSKPVPATTAEYENAGNTAPVAEPSAAVQTNMPEAGRAQKEPEKQIPATESLKPAEVTAPAAIPAKRIVNPAALTSKAKSKPAAGPKAPRKRSSAASDDIARRDEIEALHSLATKRLREQVEKNSVGKNPTKRKNIMDVFAATVPDPETA